MSGQRDQEQAGVSRARPRLADLAASVALVAVVGLVVGIVAASAELFGGPEPGGPADAAPLVPSAPPAVRSTGSPGDAEAPAVDLLPASCGDLFGSDLTGRMLASGVVLGEEDPGLEPSLDDPALAELIRGFHAIRCEWTPASGDDGRSVDTTVAVVVPARLPALEARFAELGYSSASELGGTRYYWQGVAGGQAVGEAHLLRDGLWFATHWVGLGPYGYTADMVEQVFGG